MRNDVYPITCLLFEAYSFAPYHSTDFLTPSANATFGSYPNLFLIGRNGMHRYNNQDHSMLTAMHAVDNILEGREDDLNIWEVNVEMVYHEGKSST